MKVYITRLNNNQFHFSIEKPTLLCGEVVISKNKTDNMRISAEYVKQLGVTNIKKNEIVELEIK